MKVLEFFLKIAYWPSVLVLVVSLEKEAQVTTSDTARTAARVAAISIVLVAMFQLSSTIAKMRKEDHTERLDGLTGLYSFEQREAHQRDARRYDAYSKVAMAFTLMAAVAYYICMDILF